MLLNLERDYYRDPLGYYLGCIDRLRDAGTRFVTWHDVLDEQHGRREREALLQFDVDGGPRSLVRLVPHLLERSIVATVMVHREAHDWYEYAIEDLDLDVLREAEQRGWAIGYHNNSIGNVQRTHRLGDYGDSLLREASDRFRDDVEHLRRFFDVRTFTHHGGNVYNKRTPVPDVDITPVDKPFNPQVWSDVRSSFSDGGFITRPTTLRSKIASLPPGLHFFRNHPMKYGNYERPFDVPPLNLEEALDRGCPDSEATEQWVQREREKSLTWLSFRAEHRMDVPLSLTTGDRPFTEDLSAADSEGQGSELWDTSLASRRRLDHPWTPGDPLRVWTHLVRSARSEVERGALLLVDEQAPAIPDDLGEGMPLHRRDMFSSDPIPAPCDLVASYGIERHPQPRQLVRSCLAAISAGGVAVFALATTTHPRLGSLWNEGIDEWTPSREAQGAGKGGWAFAADGIAQLFSSARDEAEVVGHRWVVRCRR